MKGVHVWDEHEGYEYHLAAAMVPAFVDDLLALQDPIAFRQKLDREGIWGDDWCAAPGSAMLVQGPDSDAIREKVLRVQFTPIGRYINRFVEPQDRYGAFRTFVLVHSVDMELGPWPASQGSAQWEVADLLPHDEAGRRMFTRWLDSGHDKVSVIRSIMQGAVEHRAA
jgi:hypothetical protein